MYGLFIQNVLQLSQRIRQWSYKTHSVWFIMPSACNKSCYAHDTALLKQSYTINTLPHVCILYALRTWPNLHFQLIKKKRRDKLLFWDAIIKYVFKDGLGTLPKIASAKLPECPTQCIPGDFPVIPRLYNLITNILTICSLLQAISVYSKSPQSVSG